MARSTRTTREPRDILTFILFSAAALGFMLLLIKGEGPPLRRYLRMRRM